MLFFIALLLLRNAMLSLECIFLGYKKQEKTLDFWRQKVRFEGEISNEKLRLTLKCKLFDKVLEALRSQMTIIITSQ